MLKVSVSKKGPDPEWDSFLETRPDCCYQQSSLWAKLKAAGGWKHLRLVVREHDKIVGGVQMLLRPLPLFGVVGYVPKGPIVASDDPAVQEFVLDQLERVARVEHVFFLKMQPPYGAEGLAQRLLERGAYPNDINVVPIATPIVDIRPEPEVILARMPGKRRSNIRRAERRGVTVRSGTEADIPTFHRLMGIHAKRQGYGFASENYIHNLWSLFAPGGHFGLLLAEYEGEALAASTNILFGDTVINQFQADSGRHRNLNANSLLHWKVMLWAKERGCAWYDIGGIDMEVVRAIMNDEPLPTTGPGGRASFKMSFGSQMVFRPCAHDVSYLWPRRLTSRMVPVLIKLRPVLDFLIGGSLSRHVRRPWLSDRRRNRAGSEGTPTK